MKPVTPRQFNDWLKKNLRYTWLIGEQGGFWNVDKGHRALIKYFYPKLDTRDMKIFRIDTNPERFSVDFRDEGEGTILDALDRKIKAEMEK